MAGGIAPAVRMVGTVVYSGMAAAVLRLEVGAKAMRNILHVDPLVQFGIRDAAVGLVASGQLAIEEELRGRGQLGLPALGQLAVAAELRARGQLDLRHWSKSLWCRYLRA